MISIRHVPLAPLDRLRLAGIKQFVARHRPAWRMTLAHPDTPDEELARLRPDGLILGQHAARTTSLPAIDIGVGPAGDTPAVRVDEADIGRIAADHLIAQRFLRLGYVGLAGEDFSDRRRDAFVAAADRAGRRVGVLELACDPFRPLPRDAETVLAGWLGALETPAAVFAANDPVALCVLRACAGLGRPVPAELAVLGVDDVDLACELADPPLSSVINPMVRVGAEGAALLARAMDGGAVPPMTWVRSEGVHARESTDVTAVGDAVVAEALALIRRRLGDREGIGVTALADALCVSRGTLHKRFLDALGHGPLREIHALRVGRARELLARTDLPMPAIAGRCGLAGGPHLTTLFRKVTGETPSAYRARQRARRVG